MSKQASKQETTEHGKGLSVEEKKEKSPRKEVDGCTTSGGGSSSDCRRCRVEATRRADSPMQFLMELVFIGRRNVDVYDNEDASPS